MKEIDVRECEYKYKDSCNLYEDKCKYISDCHYKQLQQLKTENEELKNKLDYCFEDNSSNYDKFCDICVAKDTCNGNCCYNQIKEMLGYEI